MKSKMASESVETDDVQGTWHQLVPRVAAGAQSIISVVYFALRELRRSCVLGTHAPAVAFDVDGLLSVLPLRKKANFLRCKSFTGSWEYGVQ
jgi:hypothetical protein